MMIAIIFMIVNRHTSKLFKKILNDVQTDANGEIITDKHNYSKICILILCMEKGLKSKFSLIPQLCFTIKECNIDLSNDI